MKTLSNLVTALVICLSLTFTAAATADADASSDQNYRIANEIAELEQMLTLAFMAGDYRAADELDAEIAYMEWLLPLERGSKDVSNGDIGSGRVSDIANGDLGSGR